MRHRRGVRGATAALMAAAALGAGAAPALSQAVSLEAVDSLIRVGRTEEARSILMRWTEAAGEDAVRLDRQRAIWYRGILTVDPEQAALDFQRLVVEFPGGAWTDQAFLRLALYAEARGDVARAAAFYRALLRGHPGSPARLPARAWLDRNADLVAMAEAAPPAADRGKSAGYVRPPDSVAVEPPPDTVPEIPDPAVAVADSVGLPADSASAPALPPARDSVTIPSQTSPEIRPDSAEIPTPPSGEFTVQVGAFASEQRARAFMQTVRDAGFEARLVAIPESALLRIRVGFFPDPEEATVMYDRITAKGFEAAVVADARRELPPGGGEGG